MSVEAITTHGGGDGSPDVTPDVTPRGSLQSIHFQVQLVAHTPIGVMARAADTRAVARSLPPPEPAEWRGSVALLYVVNEGAPGAMRERVRTYIRWNLALDASSQGIILQAARARRQLRAAVSILEERLQSHYALKRTSGFDLAALQREIFAGRAAELAFTRSLHALDGLAPTHVQPTLDLLVSRSSCAALQFTVERLPGEAQGLAPSAQPLRLGIVAVGAAATPDALRLLARELHGHGALMTRPLAPRQRSPKLNVFRPQNASEQTHVCHNLSEPATEPWPQTAQSVEMMFTSADAGLLLPLPFALFA